MEDRGGVKNARILLSHQRSDECRGRLAVSAYDGVGNGRAHVAARCIACRLCLRQCNMDVVMGVIEYVMRR